MKVESVYGQPAERRYLLWDLHGQAGHEVGVARQEQDCRSHLVTFEWTIGDVCADNDISAYKGASRPSYRAMLEGLRAGKVDDLLTWHTERLTRRQDELKNLIDSLDNIPVQTGSAGTTDLLGLLASEHVTRA